jgi:hypothetical protein
VTIYVECWLPGKLSRDPVSRVLMGAVKIGTFCVACAKISNSYKESRSRM